MNVWLQEVNNAIFSFEKDRKYFVYETQNAHDSSIEKLINYIKLSSKDI